MKTFEGVLNENGAVGPGPGVDKIMLLIPSSPASLMASSHLRVGGNRVLRNVQALRALSALLVVFAHLDKLLLNIGLFPRGQAAIGVFGAAVAIFFTISGFIMVHTTRDRPVTPGGFMMQRIVRIVPNYWLITLLVFAVVLVAPHLLQATRADWGELLNSLAFIPFEKANGLVEPLLFVGWTLNYEMFFYVLFAAGLLFENRLMSAALVILGLLGLVAIGLISQPSNIIARFYTDSITLEFAMGMLVALALPHLPSRASGALKVLAFTLILIGIAGAVLLPYTLPEAPPAIVCGLPATLILGAAVALERWGLSIGSPMWLLLGDASYSLYLTHVFVTQTVQLIGQWLNARGLLAILLVVCAVVLSCVLGILIYRRVERPLWQLARRTLIVRSVGASVV